MVRESELRGEVNGMHKAKALFEESDEKNRKISAHKLNLEISTGLKEVEALRKKHVEAMAQQKSYYEERMALLIEAHKKEMELREISYQERIENNERIKKEDLKRAKEMQANAMKVQKYWHKRTSDMQEFLAAATAVIRTISDRYEFLQGSMAKVQVGKTMMQDLNEKFDRINKISDKASDIPLLMEIS